MKEERLDLTCPRCKGTGRKDGTTRRNVVKCPTCKGAGWFPNIEDKRSAFGRPRQW